MPMAGKIRTFALISCLIGLGFVQSGCEPDCPSPYTCSAPPLSVSTAPNVQVNHVFIVMEENHSFTSVIGNPSMPYLNSVATTYALAKGYFADTHPSIGNYFMLTTGQIFTNDDGFSDTITEDNVVRHLVAAGKTWKEYSEGLPSVGYTGGDTGDYVQHHNPLSYFSDVRDEPAQAQNLVPFTELAVDLANHAVPNYSFIVPSNHHNGHNRDLAAADAWLKMNIAPLIQSPDFNTAGGGLLIITFDESAKCDNTAGGGQVAWIVIGPNVKKAFVSTTCYKHESTLRFMSEAAGLTSFPGAAATAPDMKEFFSGL